MIEVLQFVFGSWTHFLGTLVLVWVLRSGTPLQITYQVRK